MDGDGAPGAPVGGATAVMDAAVLAEATRDLWRGQCNCAYWHGIFGGLYLPHLRTAIYDHLIRAERLVEGVRGDTWDNAEVVDHDLDGRDEVLLESHRANVYVAPARGGTIFELDVRPADWNALATMSRYDEAYHDQIPDACEPRVRRGQEHPRRSRGQGRRASSAWPELTRTRAWAR